MSSRQSNNIPTIPEWFRDRSILITGATGFMGKVLMEKLLRSTPDIDKLYIVVRPKYGVAPSSRLEGITKLPMFQPLRESNPQALKKIVLIEGDMSADSLGMSENDRKLLQSEVSVVFHGAATVKLTDSLKSPIKLNLMGTRKLLEFCKGIKNLRVVVHVSTSYCHEEIQVLEEKLYPSLWDPRDIMNMVTWMNDECLDLVTPGILGTHANTYSLTKRLSETLIGECGHQMPVTIVRPAIVIPAVKEPLPGWVDAATGPVVILASIGKGLLKSVLMDGNTKAVVIPLDTACNATIIAAWYRGTRDVSEVPVYNLCQSDSYNVTWAEYLKLFLKEYKNYPFNWPLSCPSFVIRQASIIHEVIIFFFQLLPAYIVDFIFKLAGKKRYLVHFQTRLAQSTISLQYYTNRNWHYHIDNFRGMAAMLCDQDRTTFYTDMQKIDLEYMRKLVLGIRHYFLKEDPKTLTRARKFFKFLYVVKIVLHCLIISGLYWMMCFLVDKIMKDC